MSDCVARSKCTDAAKSTGTLLMSLMLGKDTLAKHDTGRPESCALPERASQASTTVLFSDDVADVATAEWIDVDRVQSRPRKDPSGAAKELKEVPVRNRWQVEAPGSCRTGTELSSALCTPAWQAAQALPGHA
mmetsp:Transcript_77351/g.125237  ORF Transcript_77351/g.125237 Transcript_77351/m.125237 type:complete len:133 (-) Transcript_77351:642-1040(-)